MKRELLRFQNISYRARGQNYGPLYIQLFEGELTGILTDDFFDKERLIDLFCGKVQMMKGFFYLREQLISDEEQIKIIRKINAEWVSIISGQSRLFEALSIVENIFFPHFLLKGKRMNKIVGELLLFFQLDISLSKRIDQLSILERIEIELLHAVVNKRKVIIISDVNKSLKKWEISCLNGMYKRLAQMGFTICLIESLTDVTMDMLKYFSLIRRGRTVGSGYKGEYSYQEAYCLLNTACRTEEYQNLLKKKEGKYFQSQERKILEWNRVMGKHIRDVSFTVGRGEIVQIVCQRHAAYTELVEILTGKTFPSLGRIYFDGKNISRQEMKIKIRKWKVGCVDTSINLLFTNKSIIENICYPLSLKIPLFYFHKKYIRAARDFIKETVRELDLRMKVSTLTAEQIIWVSICKWLLCKPELLLFFVPASTGMDNLDLVIKKLFIEMGIYGTSILIVTEQHEITSEIIDQIIVV